MLDEADRFAGDVIDLPASLCACVRFRGHHAESPAQYRRLMQFIREEGYTAAGFSREITVIDYGFTTDTEKFVTEIMIPLQRIKKVPAFIRGNFFILFTQCPPPAIILRAWSSAPSTALRFSRAAFSEPGRFRMRLFLLVPATARESIARGVICKL